MHPRDKAAFDREMFGIEKVPATDRLAGIRGRPPFGHRWLRGSGR
jgi:hypothetical protein